MKAKISITIGLIAILILLSSCSAQNTDSILYGVSATEYKTATCGCCGIFGQYLDKEGVDLTIETVSEAELTTIKEEYGITAELESCHTTLIEGYVVEGHVPAEAIEKLLTEQPDIVGIALPGMPAASPGMGGSKNEEWIIYAIAHDGEVTEFMRI